MNRNLPRALLLVGMTTLLGAGVATTQSMDHSMHGAATATSANKASQGGLTKLEGKAFDRAFLSMMVPHHQMAVEMARAVLPVSKDATVKAWANAVIRDQNREITQMNALLKGLGGMNTAMANEMRTRMNGMGEQVRKSRTPDVAFVQGMLPHHASALEMASLALQRGQDPRVLSLAKTIITAQAGEMLDYRTWLRKRGL